MRDLLNSIKNPSVNLGVSKEASDQNTWQFQAEDL